jgi:uncharacterized lipoprotein YmbA
MRCWPAAAVVLALAGCASPDPELYTLIPIDPAAPPAPRATPAPVVELHRATIPGYADRPELVRSAADFRVHLASNERWSEPFGDLVQSVLTQDLQRRLPGAVVYSDAGALSLPATRIVAVNIGRLESDGAGQVVLEAQFSVAGADDGATAVTQTVRLTVPLETPTTTGYAAALSQAVARLADAIAGAV